MAKKKAPPPPPTVEELKAEAIARLTHWDRTPKALIPPPTREFVVGGRSCRWRLEGCRYP